MAGKVHRVGRALVREVDHELPRAPDVLQGVLDLARYRKPLQEEIGIPVVEPTQAAVSMAIGRVRLNWASS